MVEMDEDIRLKSLLVRESFFPFLSSRFSSSPSWLWIDLVSLIRRPNDLQLLSDEDRGSAGPWSRECDEEGALGEAGSIAAGGAVFTRVGLLGTNAGF